MKPSSQRAGAAGSARLGLAVHVHPLDPISAHRAAEDVGRAAGRFVIHQAATSAAVRVLAAEAVLAGHYYGDIDGLVTRLSWSATDAASAHAWRRRRADYAVRRAAIEAIELGADLPEIEAAAEAVAADLGPLMPACRAKAIARAELAIERRRRETLADWWSGARHAGGDADAT